MGFTFNEFSPKQKKVLHWWREDSPVKDYDIIIADGAIRSGKTVAMICSFLQWSCATFAEQNFIVAGRTIGSLKRNVIKPMIQILEAWGWLYTYNRSENYLLIGSNTYYLFGANTEASQDVLQGLTAAGALADEAALFPKSFIDQMDGRCSVDGAKTFMNCNPAGSVLHTFHKDFIAIENRKKKRIYYLHFTMDDNYSLTEYVKARYRRRFVGLFFNRMIRGLWVVAEGLVYDMFKDDIHKIPYEQNKSYIEYYITIDYGTQNPCCYLLIGKYDDVWEVVKEYYYDGRENGVQKTDAEYVQDFLTFSAGITYKGVIVDPSAASFIAALGQVIHSSCILPANNDVIDGIRNVATLLGQNKLHINDNCENTLKEIQMYSWDGKSVEKDKPIKHNDHAMDALRYFVRTILFTKKKEAGTW